ncbi:MAG: hypothetical protein EA398_15275 [Deltaproteobacteria bacterium]|nr:MAG: hypothetical protein EA398_15275 [Deltaproteobacteria bacterium]
MNFYKDNDDLRYYAEEAIDWGLLTELSEYRLGEDPEGFANAEEARTFYLEILEMFGEVVAEQVAPRIPSIEDEALRIEDGEVVEPAATREIFALFRELGLFGLPVPRELGGMNAPMVSYFLTAELLARADVSTMTHYGFHAGIAMAMLVYSLDEKTTRFDRETRTLLSTRWEDDIRKIVAGEAWGSMDITEPDAGSDMAAMRATARRDEDGNWFVSGQKIYITSGHGQYHIVIARSEPDREGLDALSLFLVRAWEDTPEGRRRHVVIDRVEEKLGHHGSATCALSYEDAPAELIGKRGEGFRGMLVLMNNARIGVGFECIGLAECALRIAREYAAERRSMGKSIDRHEMIADYLEEMQTDIQAMRALAVHCAVHEERHRKRRLWLDHLPPSDEETRRAWEREEEESRAISRNLTPLLKYYAAEKAVEIAQRAIQILGGAGYIREYGAEKLLRDAMVMPIYEGTSQIQSLMAMKDHLMGMLKDPKAFLARVAEARWQSRFAPDPLGRRVARLRSSALDAQRTLLMRTAADKVRAVRHKPLDQWADAFLKQWNPKRDFAFAMLHAERFTRILVDAAVAERFWAQAQEHPHRREVLERWLERAEPRVRFLEDEIRNTGERLLARLAEGSAASEAAE